MSKELKELYEQEIELAIDKATRLIESDFAARGTTSSGAAQRARNEVEDERQLLRSKLQAREAIEGFSSEIQAALYRLTPHLRVREPASGREPVSTSP